MVKKASNLSDLKPFITNLFCCYRNDRDLLLISSLSLESYDSVGQSKQCIIATASYVHTRVNLGSALSVKNVSGLYELSVGSLSSKSLGLGISAVLCRTYSLFMSE